MLIVKRFVLFLLVVATISACSTKSQHDDKSSRAVIAFYNLENLFDTIDAPDIWDEEFTPDGKKQWDGKRYEHKLNSMASIIATLGDTVDMPGAAIVGLCEVENKGVVEALVQNEYIKDLGYEIVHQDSPDKRGIDVALLYRPELFNVTSYDAIPLFIYDSEDGERVYTRDQLLVTGKLLGQEVNVIVNHWPSRYGGEERSRPSRKAAAELTRSIVDSLVNINNNANVIVMGDLNDDPHNVSVKDVLKAVGKNDMDASSLYNPYADKHLAGEGTLCYRGTWNMFDQIIMTPNMLSDSNKLKYSGAFINDSEALRVQEGNYKGYPFRTYVGNRYDGGYSDHFPVYIVVEKN